MWELLSERPSSIIPSVGITLRASYINMCVCVCVHATPYVYRHSSVRCLCYPSRLMTTVYLHTHTQTRKEQEKRKRRRTWNLDQCNEQNLSHRKEERLKGIEYPLKATNIMNSQDPLRTIQWDPCVPLAHRQTLHMEPFCIGNRLSKRHPHCRHQAGPITHPWHTKISSDLERGTFFGTLY